MRPLRILGMIWGVLCPGIGFAEEPHYETVVRTDGVEESRPAEDPAVFAKVLKIKNPPAGTDLAAILQRVPGVRVKDSGAGGRKELSLRGAENHQSVVFLDGIRLSSASGAGVDLALFDPAHLERIEVRRGGDSARFGTGALGGVLILRTPRLGFHPRSRAAVGYGSWNTLSARISRSASVGPLRYLVSGSYKRSDGDFAYLDHNRLPAVRSNNDSQRGELLVKVDLLRSARWQVKLLDDLALSERGSPGMSTYPCASARQTDHRNLVALGLTRRHAWVKGSKIDLSASHRFSALDFRQVCDHNEPSSTEGHDMELSMRMKVPLEGVGQLDGGLETAFHLLRDLLHTHEEVPARLDLGLWIAGRASWGQRLVILPAVRLALASRRDMALIPRLGVMVRPLGRWAGWLADLWLVGNVGRSFRYPGFAELYINMDSLRGNPGLRAEDSLDWDLGCRWDRRGLSLEAAFFWRRIKNMILFAPVSPFLVEARNHEYTSALGIEASAEVALGLGLSWDNAYTWTRTRFGAPATLELPGHPEHRFVSRAQWTFPWRKGEQAWACKLWAGVTVESGAYLDRFNTETFKAAERTLLTVGGSFTYRFLTLSAEGHNLLDQRDLVDAVGFPLPPARFMLSGSLSL